VYDWCTDFREDDYRITSSKARRKILEKTKDRVIYTSRYKSHGRTKKAVNIVSLRPPNAWHLDFIGDEDNETGDYRLTRLGPQKTRLDMVFTEKYKTRNPPSKADDLSHTNEVWDKYVVALMKDYRRGH
jgi:hypothetical protein